MINAGRGYEPTMGHKHHLGRRLGLDDVSTKPTAGLLNSHKRIVGCERRLVVSSVSLDPMKLHRLIQTCPLPPVHSFEDAPLSTFLDNLFPNVPCRSPESILGYTKDLASTDETRHPSVELVHSDDAKLLSLGHQAASQVRSKNSAV